ncbi:hypothetical protein Lser_V15G18834 [Lactuca serriola]
MFAKKRYAEKVQMKKTLTCMKNHQVDARWMMMFRKVLFLPIFLIVKPQHVQSNTVKQKRKEKAGKWDVPLPKVRPVAEDEMFKVIRAGKRETKQWKRMITKVTFVYALIRKRDTLCREQNKKSDDAALLKEKDEIITQVMEKD